MPEKKQKNKPAGKDRHGLPQLSQADDLFALFNGVQQASATGQNETGLAFAELFADKEFSVADLDRKNEEEGPSRSQPAAAGQDKIRHPRLETIDLHGLGARQAEVRTESFVRTAWASGLTTLRIITGKGLHSQGEAVLQEVVEAKLAQLRQSGLVLESRWEKGARHRSGAVIVRLAKGSKRRAGEGAKRRNKRV